MLSAQQIREIRNKVWLADPAMAQRDHELFCKRTWEATVHAIKCVAQEKGWPCQTFDGVYAAGRRIARAHPDQCGYMSALGCADLPRTNGMGVTVRARDVEEDWDSSTGFIDRILGFSVHDVS